jgi:hypothetical protein
MTIGLVLWKETRIRTTLLGGGKELKKGKKAVGIVTDSGKVYLRTMAG